MLYRLMHLLCCNILMQRNQNITASQPINAVMYMMKRHGTGVWPVEWRWRSEAADAFSAVYCSMMGPVIRPDYLLHVAESEYRNVCTPHTEQTQGQA